MSDPANRPFSVTLMVILIWVNAIISILIGLGGALGSDQSYGWGTVLWGVLVALIAIRISKGSRFLRMLLTVLLVFGLAINVLLIFSNFSLAGINIIFEIFLLWLLWNSKANAFFNQS